MDKHIEQLIDQLAVSTRSPRGIYSAEATRPLLDRRIAALRRRRFLRIASSVAAIIAICIFAWGTYLYITPVNILTVSTFAETKQVLLPDGSNIMLNRYSTLTYPKKFNEKNRKVSLQGGAYFAVVKDAVHPFIVQTDAVDVRVLGTEFNVEAYLRDELVTTTLFEGSVAMDTECDQTVVLVPGERAVYDKVEKRLTKEMAPMLGDAIAWQDGGFVFSSITLKEITRQLANAFNVEIQIEDEQLAEYKMTGRFVHRETLDDILSLMQEVIPFNIEKGNQIIRILSKH